MFVFNEEPTLILSLEKSHDYSREVVIIYKAIGDKMYKATLRDRCYVGMGDSKNLAMCNLAKQLEVHANKLKRLSLGELGV